jgi:hypothetical protein
MSRMSSLIVSAWTKSGFMAATIAAALSRSKK